MGYIGPIPAQVPLTSSDIEDGIITADKLATDSVETVKVKDVNVTAGKLAATQDLSSKTITLPASVAGLATGITNAQLAGSIADAKITALSSSKLSGVVPTANLGSGSASSSTYLAGNQTYQTITEYNDDALRNDVATLALHQATNANAAKYNLVNTNVDQYEDSTGIASFTDCARNAAEYVSSISVSTALATPSSMAVSGFTDNGIAYSYDGASGNGNAFVYTTTSSTTDYVTMDMGASYTWTQVDIGKTRGQGDFRTFKVTSSADNITYVDVDLSGTTESILWSSGSGSVATHITNAAANGTADYDAITTTYQNVLNRLAGVTPFTARYLRIKGTSADYHNANANFTEFAWYKQTTTVNATGSYISTASTAPASTSTLGAVIVYKDLAGTNTLNTDIVLEVSANGGTNYTTAVLTAGGTFSTGVLQAVANDISVTAGTSIQYRISFANQADASKEARIYGASLIY